MPAVVRRAPQQVCSFLGAGLSRAEWSTYAPDIPYQQTCPRTTPELALRRRALVSEPASQRPHGVERGTQAVLRVGGQRVGALEDAL